MKHLQKNNTALAKVANENNKNTHTTLPKSQEQTETVPYIVNDSSENENDIRSRMHKSSDEERTVTWAEHVKEVIVTKQT